jgi:hypothetical protein
MAKRRKSRKKSRKKVTKARRRKAAKRLGEAFDKIGAESRERKKEFRRKLKEQMARALLREGVPGVENLNQARGLASRLSSAGFKRKIRAKVRGEWVLDKRGRWHRPDGKLAGGTAEKPPAALRRSQAMRAHWAEVRMVSDALGVSMTDARRTLSEARVDVETLVEGDTP